MALAIRIGAPASPPATAISSRSTASFMPPVNMATGAQPMTMAHGIGSRRLLCFFQCRYPPAPPMRDAIRTPSLSVAFNAPR